MGKKIHITLLVILLLSAFASMVTAAPSQNDIQVQVSLDRDTIGMDEQAMLMITVTGKTQNIPAPQMPTLSMFDVTSQGQSSNFSYDNGVITSSLTYQFLLLPTKAGTFPIDNISVVYNNKRYKGNKVDLTVLSKGSTVTQGLSDKAQTTDGKSKDYFLEAVVDNKNPYVNEQIILTLKFYIAVQSFGSPELTEPTTTGFWTEILGNKSPYYQNINNRRYRVIERKYALFPTQTGELEIGRAMIKVTVASRSRSRGGINDLFGNFFGRGEDVSVRSNIVKVKVKPLPIKGRPADFTGTIGKFNISTSVNKQNVEANQPVSLTIKITGTGNIKSVAEPNIPVDEDKFRVYRASTNENVSKVDDRIGGSKVFEEVFIPKRPGKLEIPAINYNYFDPKAGRYREITTNPIALNVTKPEGFVTSNDLPYTSPNVMIGSDSRDIRFIKENLGDTHPVGKLILSSPLYLTINTLPVLVFIGMVFVRVRKEKLAGDIGYARSKAALKEAKKRLSKAKSLAHTDKSADFYLEIYTALTSFIADKLNISPYGLTMESIKELLLERNASEEMVKQIIDLMQHSDFARYAPASIEQQNIDEDLKKAEDLMVQMVGVHFG